MDTLHIKRIGSAQAHGSKAHLAYFYVGVDGVERYRIACSCPGTAQGAAYNRLRFYERRQPNCKGSLAILSCDASPLAHAWRAGK